MNKELLKPYDSIRPFEPDELPEVFERLLANAQFRSVLGHVMPDVPLEAVAAKMRSCKTNFDFQLAFCYIFIKKLLAKASTGCDFDCSKIDNRRHYTFISNHRDIVLDSALLDVLLVEAGFPSTCEIAIGDNLLSLPWVKDLVRVNRSFIVERGLPLRQMLAASRRLSEYMHLVIGQKRECIWIAQREGRAKDSNDRTQEAILKMMTMAGEGDMAERLRSMHIVPLSISYEYDPCDYLKAREMQLRRDIKDWRKQPGDDILSMRTGIMGYKGRIHYHCAPCLDEWLESLPSDISKTEFYTAAASHIDEGIFANYRLYPNNYIAIDLLDDSAAHSDKYSAAERAAFEQYVEGQISKIDLDNRDDGFLRESILTMYANPARNHQKTCETAKAAL